MKRLPLESLTDNPIFIRELRRRMRGKAMIFSTNAYIFFMCLVAAGIIVFNYAIKEWGGSQTARSMGQNLFSALLLVQAILVLLIAPTITSGMATAERERKTFEFLKVTTLRPITFIMGGLLSTMLYAMVVLVCALPLLTISSLYGGISLSDIVLGFLLLLALSLVLSSAGLLISSTREKTRNAQGMTMVVVVVVALFLASGLRQTTGFLDWIKKRLDLPVSLFGAITLNGWVVATVAVLALSALLLMMAARKLYNSDTRPLAYRHTLILGAVLSVCFFGWSWSAVDVDRYQLWTWGSLIFFLVVAVTHSLHQLEVGNEIWALKKRIPPFRYFDESVPFVGLLLLGWAAATLNWLSNPPANQFQAGVIPYAVGAFAATFMAISLSARCFAQRSGERGTAFKHTLYFWGVTAGALPFLAKFWGGLTGERPVMDVLALLNPYYQVQTPLTVVGGTSLDLGSAINALLGATTVLAVLAVGFGLGAFYFSRRHPSTVHYDYALSV